MRRPCAPAACSMRMGGTALALVVVVVAALIQGAAATAAAAYKESAAIHYLFYSRASSCTPASLQEWRCGSVCRAAPIVSSSSRVLGPSSRYEMQGYVARTGREECIVAFRGSSNVANYLADADLLWKSWPSWETKRPCMGCEVHKGFSDAYEDLREEMLSALHELRCQRTAVVGHSLGASLATLAAMELRVEFGIPVGPVYLFGAPRVGNRLFAEAFEAAAEGQGARPAAWRVIHSLDPVPRIPLAFMGYQHFSREVYYTEASDAYRVCDARNGEDPKCSAECPVPLIPAVPDHLRYLNISLAYKDLPVECTGKAEDAFLVV